MTNGNRPADTTRFADQSRPADTTRFADQSRPADATRPADQSRPASETNPPRVHANPTQDALEAGNGVLGAMLIDPDCVGAALARLEERDFLHTDQQAVFRAIKAQFMAAKPTDGIAVAERLYAAGYNLRDYMAKVMELTPTSANAMAYAEALKETAALYRLRDAGERLRLAKSLDECQAILDEAQRLRVGRPDVHAVTFAQAYEDFFRRHDSETAVKCLDWDIPALNQVLRVEPGHLVIVGAYPGVGKTAFALQCAARFARTFPVGYYSYESTSGQLYDRHAARVAMLDSGKIRRNQLSEEDYHEILNLRPQLADPPVTLVDAAGMTAEDVIAHAQSSHFAVVCVDYVQKVKVRPQGRRAPTEYERVTEVSSAFQEFAVRTGTAVVLLSQLTRPAKVSQKFRDRDGTVRAVTVTPPPTLSALRSSGQLEQDADVVLLMWREEDDWKHSPRVIQVAKNRHGEALDKVRCAFDGAHQTFTRLEAREAVSGKQAEPGQMGFWEEPDAGDLPF